MCGKSTKAQVQHLADLRRDYVISLKSCGLSPKLLMLLSKPPWSHTGPLSTKTSLDDNAIYFLLPVKIEHNNSPQGNSTLHAQELKICLGSLLPRNASSLRNIL